MWQMFTDEELAAAEVESAAMQLPRARRAEIAARLIASLDEETPVENAWADEVRRRVKDYRAGRAKTRPIDEVLDEVGGAAPVKRLGFEITDEPRIEDAWAAELRERIRAVKAGEMKLVSEVEAEAEVEELLGK